MTAVVQSPAEETIRIVPFHRRVEIEAVQPAFFALGSLNGTVKTSEDRRTFRRPAVRRQLGRHARAAKGRVVAVPQAARLYHRYPRGT